MPKDRRQLELLLEKTQRMICAECLKDRHAHWEIRFFGVNKGKFDIRIACHGSGNGTNLVALSPSFFLPNTLTWVRKLQPNTYQMDMDIGEMFLNFPLHLEASKHCGVNVIGIRGLDLPTCNTQLSLTTLWMWIISSSANSLKHLSLAEEVIKGHHVDESDPFNWISVVLNLPGALDFEPSMTGGYELKKSKVNS